MRREIESDRFLKGKLAMLVVLVVVGLQFSD
jgi:hypothetical protein